MSLWGMNCSNFENEKLFLFLVDHQKWCSANLSDRHNGLFHWCKAYNIYCKKCMMLEEVHVKLCQIRSVNSCSTVKNEHACNNEYKSKRVLAGASWFSLTLDCTQIRVLSMKIADDMSVSILRMWRLWLMISVIL